MASNVAKENILKRKRKYTGMLQQDTRAKLMKQLKKILKLIIQSNTRKDEIHVIFILKMQNSIKKEENGERKIIQRSSRNE